MPECHRFAFLLPDAEQSPHDMTACQEIGISIDRLDNKNKACLKLDDKVPRLQGREPEQNSAYQQPTIFSSPTSWSPLPVHLRSTQFPQKHQCTTVQRQQKKPPFIPSNQPIRQAQVLQLNPTTFDRPVTWISYSRCDAKLWSD